jgi:hypothetical protein
MLKMRIAILASAIAVCVPASGEKAATDDWVGVWNAHPGGEPTGTVTLATDTGELGGTIVLDIVSREGGQPHVIASEPHVMMHPRLAGSVLSFAVKMPRKGELVEADFTMTVTAQDKATIHCTSCGPNAPTVELTRDGLPFSKVPIQ